MRPSSFTALFQVSREGVNRADHCEALLRHLDSTQTGQSEFGIGRSQGIVLVELDPYGKIVSQSIPPIGAAITDAFKAASLLH
jgi:hypothetical protein